MVSTMNSTTPHSNPTDHLHGLARDIVTRAVAVVGLGGIALIHLLDSIGKFSETPYIAWMYVALMLGSVATAGLLIASRSKAGFLAAGGLAASAIVGYVLSRTTGLPNAMGDVGNWTEPLGLASLFVEGCVVAVSGLALAADRLPSRAKRLTSLDPATAP